MLDITVACTTFPEKAAAEVTRDNAVEYLFDALHSGHRVIVVQGTNGAGKSVLLAQFARSYRGQCISFFFGTSPTKSNPQFVLLELCEQIAMILGVPSDDFYSLPTEKLRSLFFDLQRRLSREAKRSNRHFFFVVDGLELLPDQHLTEILDFLPIEPLASCSLLTTSESKRELTFRHEAWPILPFSERETEAYFEELDLPREDIKRIRKSSGGLPGYLSVVRRLLNTGTKIEELPSKLPNELSGLFDYEWRKLDWDKPFQSQLLSLISFSREPLTPSNISAVLKVGVDLVLTTLERLSFLVLDKQSETVAFSPEGYRLFSADKLTASREQTESLLIHFYGTDPFSKEALYLLPSYLAGPSRYQQLKSLVSTSYLTRGLASSQDIAPLAKTLSLTAKEAIKAEDWQCVQKVALLDSILRTISQKPVAQEEILAYCEIGDFQQAIERSYQSILVEDRLELLARVCTKMRHAGLSAPENIISEMEEMAIKVDAIHLGERAIEIAAVIFDDLPESAISLVERSTEGKAGERSLDLARATLALRVKDDVDQIWSRITDKTLTDFAQTFASNSYKRTAEEIIAQAERTRGTSAKLLKLVSWCNANRTEASALAVIQKAVDVIGDDPNYGTSIRLLRQLAEPLKAADPNDVQKLAERLEIYVANAKTRPAEELIRFQLIMAAIEVKSSKVDGVDRMLETYFSIFDIEELDTRCSGLARVLIALPEIDPNNTQNLATEILAKLDHEFNNLLAASADQYQITRQILRAMSLYDIGSAVSFSQRLNEPERRDLALRSSLWNYCRNFEHPLDVQQVIDSLEHFSEVERKEIALVGILDRCTEAGRFMSEPDTKRLLDLIPTAKVPSNMCLSAAFAIKGLDLANDEEKVKSFVQYIEHNLNKVPSTWDRVRLALEIASITGSKTPDLAKSLLNAQTEERRASPLSEESFVDVYHSLMQILLVSYSRMLSLKCNENRFLQQIISLIRTLPSFRSQCIFFADLALRHFIADETKFFRETVENEVLPLLDKCEDPSDRIIAIVTISPCLFEYDATLVFDLLNTLSPSHKDRALWQIFNYCLSHKSINEHVDIDRLATKADARTARRLCEIISHVMTDANLFFMIDGLVKSIVGVDGRNPNKEVCTRIIYRDVMDIAGKLDKIVQFKLPNPKGLPHDGYSVVCRASIARLRAASPTPSGLVNAAPKPDWAGLAKEARAIPNAADKPFVLALLGERAYRADKPLAVQVLEESEQAVKLIPTLFDRAQRFYYIAEAWKHVDNKQQARMLLQESMMLLQVAESDSSRDQLTGKILQLAHDIEPAFASNLTPLIDNPLIEHERRLGLTAHTLQKDPGQLGRELDKGVSDQKEQYQVLGDAAYKMLSSLNAGAGHFRSPQEVGRWTMATLGASFEEASPVASWALYNAIGSTAQPSVVIEYHQILVDTLQASLELSRILLGTEGVTSRILQDVLPTNLRLFHAGTRPEAISTVASWIKDNAEEYVKVYDPYLNAEDLEILAGIDADCQVFIFTSWKSQKGFSPGDRGVKAVYQAKWEKIFAVPRPWSQVLITGTKSGDSPLHSRYIVTAGKGLNLGTSISGLGLKDTDIRVLDSNDAKTIESEFIDGLLVPQLALYNNETLLTVRFGLS